MDAGGDQVVAVFEAFKDFEPVRRECSRGDGDPFGDAQLIFSRFDNEGILAVNILSK